MTAFWWPQVASATLLASAELGPKALEQALNIVGDLSEQLRCRVAPYAADLLEGDIEPERHIERIAVTNLSQRQPGDLQTIVQRLTQFFTPWEHLENPTVKLAQVNVNDRGVVERDGNQPMLVGVIELVKHPRQRTFRVATGLKGLRSTDAGSCSI